MTAPANVALMAAYLRRRLQSVFSRAAVPFQPPHVTPDPYMEKVAKDQLVIVGSFQAQ